MRMLDLFSGRWGWSKAFAARGWKCVGIDLVAPPEVPDGCTFIRADIMQLQAEPGGWFSIREFDDRGPILWREQFDFVCASSPCEQFSVHGMRCFHPNPKFPALGLQLFNHTRMLCEVSGVPHVMENVRAAQEFVGNATHHCGPFYLWGSGVPPILPQGITKGIQLAGGMDFSKASQEERKAWRKTDFMLSRGSKTQARKQETAKAATIPPELANCVADFAERILECERVA